VGCVAPSGYVGPVATYDHGVKDSFGCSLTDGYVYRGSNFASLQGVYFYGDYCSGKVLGLIKNANNTWSSSLITSTGYSISSFGQDEQGELYLAAYGTGTVYEISAVPPTISGNAGIDGANLNFIDGTAKTATSAADGSYSFAVSRNWSGTVTPSKTCYTFNPLSTSYTNVKTDQTAQNYTAAVNPAARCATLEIKAGGSLKGSYALASSAVLEPSYPNLMSGPVQVRSTNGLPIFASQRSMASMNTSFNEVMGLPTSKFDTDFWFPWYDQRSAHVFTWILVGNPDPVQTATVDIYIGGVKQTGSPYSIPPGGNITPTYPGLLGGPVRVVSTTGSLPIFASERTVVNGSFHEVLGVPAHDFTTEYWFPWYDQKSANVYTWIMVGNPDPVQDASVDIYVASLKQGTYSIPAGGIIAPTYPGLLGGPVRVVSTSGSPSSLPIFASERSVIFNSFNETMGYPAKQLTTDYWFPWYDDMGMTTWLLVGNPDPVNDANVDIYIGGTKVHSETIPHNGGSIAPLFPGENTGPVHVVSTNGVNIFTSQRVIYSSAQSFDEMMGYPGNQLSSEYWFTWYDNITMNTGVLIGKP
jgi:hypothetical protein